MSRAAAWRREVRLFFRVFVRWPVVRVTVCLRRGHSPGDDIHQLLGMCGRCGKVGT